MRISINNLDVEESPCTLAYAMLVMLSGVYGYGVTVSSEEDLVVVLDAEGSELFEIEVAGVFADLLVSVLHHVGEQIDGVNDDDETEEHNPWNSLIY